MRTRLIVLDVDDTLYLECDYVRSGFRAVSDYVDQEFGFGGFYDHAWESFLAGRRGNIFDEVLTMLPDDRRPSVPDLVAVYRNHRPDITLCPDARAFLDEVAGDFHLGVVTDGPVASQRNKIEALGLDRWVTEFVVTGEHGPTWHKPSLLPFRHLEEAFGVHGAECVYIADNPHKDFVGPTELGWQAVRMVRPFGLHAEADDAESSRPDARVDGFGGMLDILH
ncbi:HAD family hydrolase [Corynebacterium nasicanis]|uniref:HAD family hydrolase n=1 Tax=Corynebacterium nasicanis TaxID=1448267 RepID=A0ABW1QBE3_9CORY